MKRLRWTVALILLMAIACQGATLAASLDQALDIWPIMTAPVGTEQTYVFTQHAETKLVERQGILLLQPQEAFEASLSRMLRVTYRVLEPDAAGNVRLYVAAHPLHPESGQPLLFPTWEGIYRFEPFALVLETDLPPPAGYAHLIHPEWLNWVPSEHEFPNRQILPGAHWPAETHSVDQALFDAGDTVTAEASRRFVGWESLDATGRAAVIEHTAVTQAVGIPQGAFRLTAEESVRGSVRLLFGDLPWDANETKQLILHAELQPHEAGGLTGSLTTLRQTDLKIVRTAGPAAGPVQLIQLGDVRDGMLQTESWDLGDGTQADVYIFSGAEREQVRIALESHDFDAYLLLLDNEWNIIAEDDDSGGDGHALVDHVLPYSGSYLVVVNTYFADELGRYTLALESFGRQVDAEAVRQTLEDGLRAVDEAITIGDWDRVAHALEAAVADTRAQLPLTIIETRLVAERPIAYGEYVPRTTRVYSAGELVQLYLEPANFHLRRDGERHEIHLAVDAVLLDSRGNVVSDLPDVVVLNRLALRPLRDVFIALPLWVHGLGTGNYVWQITVRDEVSGQSATTEAPFVILGQGISGGFLP